ncbi:hypothetical protein ACMD2_00316 [Ananas comosus]|uniref:Uncharacterized protein n=1 Tax=Ananas comosus TaxID=4615 RepID=A0A199W2P1_ANACO|nr:hypothetical protein ACMD2_00316 [Ananas comosus]
MDTCWSNGSGHRRHQRDWVRIILNLWGIRRAIVEELAGFGATPYRNCPTLWGADFPLPQHAEIFSTTFDPVITSSTEKWDHSPPTDAVFAEAYNNMTAAWYEKKCETAVQRILAFAGHRALCWLTNLNKLMAALGPIAGIISEIVKPLEDTPTIKKLLYESTEI